MNNPTASVLDRASALTSQVRELLSDPKVAGISINAEYDSTTHTVTPTSGVLQTFEKSEDGKDTKVLRPADGGDDLGLFRMPDGRKAVTIDSWGSQANRFERGLKNNAKVLGYPLITLGSTDSAVSFGTSLDWSHRHADATWRLSADRATESGIPFAEIRDATVGNAGALLKYFPNSILFGWWDSHVSDKGSTAWTAAGHDAGSYELIKGHGRGGDHRRSSRVITSEIIAVGVEIRQRFAARVDSLFGPLGDKQSAFGIGSLPPMPGPRDVTFEQILGKSFISLSYLKRFDFGELNDEGKIAIVLLALAGIVGADDDLHLRTGADLIMRRRAFAVERHGDAPAPLELDLDIEVIAAALKAVSEKFGWAEHPIDMAGSKLERVLQKALTKSATEAATTGEGE